MPQNRLKAVILAVHSIEYNAVLSYISEHQEITIPQGTIYERGTFFASEITWDILLGQIGEGNIESAIEAERAIRYFQPDVILSIGLAYGFKDVQVGDVVAATKVYGYEHGKETEDNFQSRPEVGQSTNIMIHRARAEGRNVDWQRLLPWTNTEHVMPKVFVGPIAAGEKEIASSSKLWQFLENHYNDTLALDTSGSGFLGATHSNSHIEALIVRGIVGIFSSSLSTASVQKAAYHASAFAFTVLSKLTRHLFPQSEGPLVDPLVLLEQLAYGNISATSSNDGRNITLHSATSSKWDLPSPSTKEAQEWFDRGNKHFQQQAYKEAVKSYNKAFRMNKRDCRICNNKGIALFHLGDYVEALNAYASAIDCDPSYADAYSNKAAAHYKLGHYSDAQASYQHAIDLYNHELASEVNEKQKDILQKRLASALTGLGDTLCGFDDYKEARTIYTRALKLEPTKAAAYIGRGKCFIQQERFRDALADYKKAIEYGPNNSSSYHGRGNALQGLNQWKKALESYDQALLLNPNNAEIYYSRGIVWLRIKEYEQALGAFSAFQRLDPENTLSFKCIIATLGALQRYDEALKICEEVSQRFPHTDWISIYQQKALFEREKLQPHIEEQNTMILSVLSQGH